MLHTERFRTVMALSTTITKKTEIVFLHTPPWCFIDKHELHADIIRRISKFAKCPSIAIKFCGSAHLGFSPHKGSDFVVGRSDLDVAIISKDLYLDFIEESRIVTNNYTDLTPFSSVGGKKTSIKFREYAIEKGLIHINSMPICNLRDKWLKFLNLLSLDYTNIFREISVSLYSTDRSFVRKQTSAIYDRALGA